MTCRPFFKKKNRVRRIAPETLPIWTRNMTGFLTENDTVPMITDPHWISAPGQQYILAKEACPPESYARNQSSSLAQAKSLYKDDRGGFVTNFNRSPDLCTIGPDIQDK